LWRLCFYRSDHLSAISQINCKNKLYPCFSEIRSNRWCITAVILIVANAIVFSTSAVSEVEKTVLSIVLIVLMTGLVLFSCGQFVRKFYLLFLKDKKSPKPTTSSSHSNLLELGERLSSATTQQSAVLAVRVLSTNVTRKSTAATSLQEEMFEGALISAFHQLTPEGLLSVLQIAMNAVGLEAPQSPTTGIQTNSDPQTSHVHRISNI
jgi:hypothetical protein